MKQFMSCIVVSIVLAHGGVVLAQCCICDGDLNGDNTLDPPLFGPDDAELVLQCFQGDQAACAACVVPDCDVDCDGVTSFDDVNAVLCMFQAGGSPNLSCCGGGRGGLPLCECNFDSECAAEQAPTRGPKADEHA